MADETGESEAANAGLVRCDVTGKMVPESETVVLRGRRVCAEGKAILLEMLAAGLRLPGETDHTVEGVRVLGAIIDVALAFVLYVVMMILGPVILPLSTTNDGLFLVLAIGTLFVHGAHLTWFQSVSGQSLGKMMAGVKVVRMDGSRVDAWQSLLRTAMLLGPWVATLAVAESAVLTNSAEVEDAVWIVAGVSLLLMLIDIVVAAVDRVQFRTIHDRLTGTRVVCVAQAEKV